MFTYHWGSIEVKKHAFQGDFSDIETFTPLANLYYRSLLPILGKITVFPGAGLFCDYYLFVAFQSKNEIVQVKYGNICFYLNNRVLQCIAMHQIFNM